MDEAAAALRERLIACGYPADLALLIEVTAPPVRFTTRLGAQ